MLTERHMQINLRRRDILMTQKLLDCSQIRTVFQEMGRKTVAQGVCRHALIDAHPRRSPFHCLRINIGV